jgi:hypothetical protein
MSNSQCTTESAFADSHAELGEAAAQPASNAGASRLLKGLLIGFAATMMIAFGLASWYLSTRILAVDSPAPDTSSVTKSPPAAAMENKR